MLIKSAEFVVSAPRVEQCPASEGQEIAFIGRSNVGKSSLINMLTGKQGLCKTSATPGKTLLINHFKITLASKTQGEKTDANRILSLVDLPGYGYAKRSKKVLDELDHMIRSYILRREQLHCLFLLIDVRHEQQRIDREFVDWLGENGVPFAVIFTKADKLSAGGAAANAKAWMQALRKPFATNKAKTAEEALIWDELPPYFITSSEKRLGRDAVLDYIEEIL